MKIRCVRQDMPYFFKFIGFGCQKVVFNFESVKLHKTELVLFRCPKIRKTKYA